MTKLMSKPPPPSSSSSIPYIFMHGLLRTNQINKHSSLNNEHLLVQVVLDSHAGRYRRYWGRGVWVVRNWVSSLPLSLLLVYRKDAHQLNHREISLMITHSHFLFCGPYISMGRFTTSPSTFPCLLQTVFLHHMHTHTPQTDITSYY